MRLATGETFAGFRIIRLLGSGGMGEVYLVDHPRLPRQEALKILSADVTLDTEYRQRFNREADLAAELWHPHIVAVHDRGEFGGQLWITMDYVEGTDAAALVRDRFPSGVPVEFAAEIVGAVADALDYAHERGLLHRDVKPANILLSDADPAARRRRILLSDFGIARKMDDVSGLTATNMTVGSIAYAAPEQLMGQTLDGRADQYALAATAFQLLTGRPPFDNSNPAVVISCHLSAPPPTMGEQRPDLSHLDAVITKAMAKDPADRFATCHEFSEALAGAISSRPGIDHETMVRPAADAAFTEAPTQHAVPSSPPADIDGQAAAPKARSWGSRRGWMVAGVLGVALLAVGGLLIVQLTSSSPSESAVAPTGGLPTSTQGLPAAAVDGLLLTAAQASAITGQTLTVDSTSNQPLDASATLAPTQCDGAIYPGEMVVYKPTGFSAFRQSLMQTPQNQASSVYHIVDQSVALLPTPAAAQQFQADSKAQWQECVGQPITVSNADGTTTTSTLPDVVTRDNLIVQDRQVSNPGSADVTCQHTMGVWFNVVAETVVCGETDVGDQSQRIVNEILSNAQKRG